MTARKPVLFDLRAGGVDALLLSPRTGDTPALLDALGRHLDAAPDFFRGESLVIDLRRVPEGERLDLGAVSEWLAARELNPLGLVGAPDAARESGLPLLHSQDRRVTAIPGADAAPATASAPSPTASAAAPPATTAAAPAAAPSLLVDRPLRSGQRVYAAGDVIVLDAVSHGAEIIAGGNIHVYAALRGRALAGAHGDAGARIFCSCLEPELVAIAGVYRTAEQALPPEIAGKSAQVLLDGGTLRFEPLRTR